MKLTSLILSILFLAVAVVIPLYFIELLLFSVLSIGLGWTLTSILIRVLVILFFAGFLSNLFKIIFKSKKIKFIWVFLIAILPGFGVSFISPIYNTDYGLINDGVKLTNLRELETEVGTTFLQSSGHTICAFFTTGCPHCANATFKFGINIKAGQKVPVVAFFPGNKEDTEKFLEKNNGSALTYFLIDNDDLFLNLSGGIFPSIFLLNEKGETIFHWTGDEMNYTALDYLLNLEQ